MSKFILIFLAVVVLIFAAFSFVLGMARRFFGNLPGMAARAGGRNRSTDRNNDNPVLYHDSDTEVLRGESAAKAPPSYNNIRDASFTEINTDASPRRRN